MAENPTVLIFSGAPVAHDTGGLNPPISSGFYRRASAPEAYIGSVAVSFDLICGGPGLATTAYELENSPKEDEFFVVQYQIGSGPWVTLLGGKITASEASSEKFTTFLATADIRQTDSITLRFLSRVSTGSATAAQWAITNIFVRTKSDHDNEFVRHQIPASDMSYSWVKASATKPVLGYESDNHLDGESISFLTIGSGSSHTGTAAWGGAPGRVFNNTPNLSTGDPLYTDFVGMNHHIYEPVSIAGQPVEMFHGFPMTHSEPNILGYPALVVKDFTNNVSGVWVNYINSSVNALTTPPENTAGDHPVVGAPDPSTEILNSIIANRQGPYGWPTFKQIRGGDHPIIREHKKINMFSYLKGAKVITNVVEPAFDTNDMVKIIDVKNTKYSIVYKDSFLNRNTRFADEGLNLVSGLGRLITRDMFYDDFTYLDFRQKIFPKSVHVGLKSHRYRKNFQINYWHPDVTVRARGSLRTGESAGLYNSLASRWAMDGSIKSDSYSVLYTLEDTASKNNAGTTVAYDWVDSVALLKDDGVPYLEYNNESPSNSFSEEQTEGVLMNPNFSNFVKRFEGTEKALESRRNFLSKVQTTPRYVQFFPIYKPLRDIIRKFDESEAALIDAGTAAHKPFRHYVFKENSSVNSETRMWFDNILVGKQKWTASDDHPIGPMYSSYELWAQDVRPHGQDFSIVPEFRIGNHIDGLLESEKSVLHEETFKTKLLEIGESRQTAHSNNTTGPFIIQDSPPLNSETDSFYRIYTYSDFIKVFDLMETENLDLELRKVKLSATAIKKFLPHEGFYPLQRTTELVNYFSSSYYSSIVPVSGEEKSVLHNGITYDMSKTPWATALFSPGILYNTIKSGLAVDYPIFTGSYEVAPISPYVVNYKQIGVSPHDFTSSFGHNIGGTRNYGLTHGGAEQYAFADLNAGTPSWAYGETISCGDMYSPHYFKVYSGNTSSKANWFTGSFPSPVRYALGAEQETGAGFDFRIPFEAIIDPEKFIDGELTMKHMGAWHPESFIDVVSSIGAPTNPKYKLAANNFFAESINFFLADGKLTTMRSLPDNSKSFGIVKRPAAEYEYRMRLYLLREPAQFKAAAREKKSYGRDYLDALADNAPVHHSGPFYEYEKGESPSVTFKKFLIDYFDKWEYSKGFNPPDDPNFENSDGLDTFTYDNSFAISPPDLSNLTLDTSTVTFNHVTSEGPWTDLSPIMRWGVYWKAVREEHPSPSCPGENDLKWDIPSKIMDTNDIYRGLYDKFPFCLNLRYHFVSECAKTTTEYSPESVEFTMYNNKTAFGPPCTSIEGWNTLHFPYYDPDNHATQFSIFSGFFSDGSSNQNYTYPENGYVYYSPGANFPINTSCLKFGKYQAIADGELPMPNAAGRTNGAFGWKECRTSTEVQACMNTTFDNHYHTGMFEPLIGYDFRPYTPPYYEGYAYADFIFRPPEDRKYSIEEILANIDIEFYRKRDLVKYASAARSAELGTDDEAYRWYYVGEKSPHQGDPDPKYGGTGTSNEEIQRVGNALHRYSATDLFEEALSGNVYGLYIHKVHFVDPSDPNVKPIITPAVDSTVTYTPGAQALLEITFDPDHELVGDQNRFKRGMQVWYFPEANDTIPPDYNNDSGVDANGHGAFIIGMIYRIDESTNSIYLLREPDIESTAVDGAGNSVVPDDDGSTGRFVKTFFPNKGSFMPQSGGALAFQPGAAVEIAPYGYVPRYCGADYPDARGFMVNESTWNRLNPLRVKTPLHMFNVDFTGEPPTLEPNVAGGYQLECPSVDVIFNEFCQGVPTYSAFEDTAWLFYRYSNRVSSRETLNYKGQMQLDSSFNLLSIANIKNFEYDSEGNLITIREDTNMGGQWVISPKFETPVLNFQKWLEKDVNGQYVHADKIEPEEYFRRDVDIVPEPIVGMWHQEGEIPNSNEGLQMLITDTPGVVEGATGATAVVRIHESGITTGKTLTLIDHLGVAESYTAHAADGNETTEGARDFRFDGSQVTPTTTAKVLAAQINLYSEAFSASTKGNTIYISTNILGSSGNRSKIHLRGDSDWEIVQAFSGAGNGIPQHGSLADLVGFKKGEMTPLGRISETKKVREAIIAIPMMASAASKTRDWTMPLVDPAHVRRILRSPSTKGNLEQRELADIPASLVSMVDKLQNYVLPPQLNFLDYPGDIDPFLCFVLEFEHKFTQQDLADIWQNLYPRDSAKVEIVDSSFEHDLLNFPNFVLDENTRWMVFKVKQKAKKNYFNMVEKSIKDYFDFTPEGTIARRMETEEEPVYSYNWPYDYFSLVELVKIDAEVGLTQGNIPTFEEYMSLASEIGNSDKASPAELMNMVESASKAKTAADIEAEEARLAELRRVAIENRRRWQKEQQKKRSITIERAVYRNPEGVSYIIANSGRRINLTVDSEGRYYYYRVMSSEGEETASRADASGARKVVVIPSMINSEGSATSERNRAQPRRNGKSSRRKRKYGPPE